MTYPTIRQELAAAHEELAWLREQQAQQAAAAQLQWRVAHLERQLEREREDEIAIALDPDYPRKLAEARQAEADSRAALDRVMAARLHGSTADDADERRAVVKLKMAGAMLRSPTPAEQMAEDAWKLNRRRLRDLERWPRRAAAAAALADAEARSIDRVNARRAERGMPMAGTRRMRRKLEEIPAIEPPRPTFRMPSLGGF